MMKSNEFCDRLLDIAISHKTLYVKGCFGSPLNDANKKRYTQNNSYNILHRSSILKASSDTFGFDCVCLIKGVLWGWNGNTSHIYGGAVYQSNSVPDISADNIITKCTSISTDFSKIVKGSLVWIKGHVGVYIGDGVVVECTSKWENKVQHTLLSNIQDVKENDKARQWSKWGLLPYVDYSENRELHISVNGTVQTVDGFIENGKTYIWLRDLSDILGYQVTYDEVQKLPGIITK